MTMSPSSSSPASETSPGVLQGSHATDPLASRARERLREAQAMLASLGYAVSHRQDRAAASDGVFGNNTREAIRQFQVDQAMDVKGQLDDETWEALGEAFEEARGVTATSSDQDEAADDVQTLLAEGVHQTTAELVSELAEEADADDEAEREVVPPEFHP